jgi:excisionase family DNA binding protein
LQHVGCWSCWAWIAAEGIGMTGTIGMIIVVTPDPVDRRLVERAMELLGAQLRVDGSRLPMSLRGPVVHVSSASNRLEPTSGSDEDELAHDASVSTLLLSYEDCASRVPCSKRTIERAVADRQLAAKKIGRRRVIDPEDLAVWIARLPTTTDTCDERDRNLQIAEPQGKAHADAHR